MQFAGDLLKFIYSSSILTGGLPDLAFKLEDPNFGRALARSFDGSYLFARLCGEAPKEENSAKRRQS